MGLLFDKDSFKFKRLRQAIDDMAAKERQRKADRERWDRSRRRSGEPFSKAENVASILDAFREECESERWDNAPMSLWYAIAESDPKSMVTWLDANPGFVPPYGIHYGPPFSEPWRPMLSCACGAKHRYGESCNKTS